METRDTSVEVAELIALLESQRQLYVRLRLLADRQRALILNEDTQPLLGLLVERQELVDKLVALNERLGPYRESWTTIYSCLDETRRRQVAALLEESNAALGAIITNDNRDTATLRARRQGVANLLGKAETAVRTNAAYVSTAGVKSSLTDSVA
ncbi:MAG: hypothetical protein HS101_06245 [Planctomycetia bacterium]|jgi:hypothetical protein|nr:hypothetical protein [Planctomycetia bacterium]MCC7314901.1 hypothetical protein [Planctomycetota bacterium]